MTATDMTEGFALLNSATEQTPFPSWGEGFPALACEERQGGRYRLYYRRPVRLAPGATVVRCRDGAVFSLVGGEASSPWAARMGMHTAAAVRMKSRKIGRREEP